MFPHTPRWIRSYALTAGVIGAFFVTLGLLSTVGEFAQTSGTVRLQGTVKAVQAPVNSTASVHLLVQTADGHRVLRVVTTSGDPSDFAPGERTAILVKQGQEPFQDEGSGRYTSSLVTTGAGLPPLLVGIGLWRSRERLARKPMNVSTVATPR